ncbi:MAG: aminotransferase class V-fold PLP-dependent enzyme [Myxococcota bacterium]
MAASLYLNHAGTSWPKPPVVSKAFAEALAASPDTWAQDFAEAHERVAHAFDVSADTLLITPGATSAIATAIADIPLQPGDRVLTSAMEHHALARPLAKLRARGIEIVEVPRGSGPLDLEVLTTELKAGGVRLVALSMAANVTGELLPFAEVVTLAHAHGALCLLDGAQAAGWLPLSLTDLEVDLFAFAGHKGPQAPYGVGGLYVRPGVRLDTPGATRPGYCDTGSVDRPALVALAAGLGFMQEHRPLEATRAIEARFRAHAQQLGGVTVYGTGPRMPVCSLTVRGHSPGQLARALRAQGIVVSGGTQCAPRAHTTLGTGEMGTLRFSFGPTSNIDDADRAFAALAEVLRN